ncbi:DNA polymerase epsilon subunit 4 [Bulinus truncatus]|nr:DNA polymerase epsilon subunit 4 [Bulinus truncatus]
MAGVNESLLTNSLDQNELIDTEIVTEQAEIEVESSEVILGTEPQEKLIKLPLSRIRSIIKTDTDVKVVSHEAVVTLAKAAELFIQSLATEAASRTVREKRKTVLRKHLDTVFETKDCYSFLDGILESFED